MRVQSIITTVAATVALGASLLFGLTQCSTFEGPGERAGPPANRYGSYLAGRYAASERDAGSAALFFDKALKFDPSNPELLERAIMSEVARGDIDGAAAHAEALTQKVPNARIPHLVIGVRAMRDGGYAKAHQAFEKVSGNAAAEIGARLGLAYAHFSEGNFAKASEVIGKMSASDSVRAFAQYHLAVIEDLSGRSQEALKHFEEANRLSDGISLRILQAYAVHLARNGQVAKAKDVYVEFLKKAPSNPIVKAALAKLESGAVPDRVIASAKQGLAETLYGIASSLSDERSIEIPIFYLQLALALEPRHELALSLFGDRLDTAERFDEAIEVYGRIPASSPLYLNARQQIAQDLQKQEKPEEALTVLRAALDGSAGDVEIHASIGDVLRSQEKYADAADAYSRAIALIGKPQDRHWTLFYTRGISYERSKRWADAERDLKFALTLKPEQPLVMNYLAYTWVEQNVNMAQALAMLKKAVELKPEDGFIIDSLGWAYYRMGDFQSAITQLEQAILLEPGEATINDHLGDAYWRVGRKIEAKFQWQHALTLKPEKTDEAKIRNKIEMGLADLPRVPAQAGTPQSGQ
ncbi:MAG: tetratricopeptide repeat protein [Micropepsaceae bacterium]